MHFKKAICRLQEVPKAIGMVKWRVKSLVYFPRQAKAEKGHSSLKTHVRHSIPAEFVIGSYSLQCHVLERQL